jgi:hypothetical protein
MKKNNFKDAILLLDAEIKAGFNKPRIKNVVGVKPTTPLSKAYYKQVSKLVQDASKSDSWPDAVNEIARLLVDGAILKQVYEKQIEIIVLSITAQGGAIGMAKEANDKLQIKTRKLKDNGKKAADARHSQPNGSHDKRKDIIIIWKSGKYKTKSDCALKECEKIGMSHSTAIKALRNQ